MLDGFVPWPEQTARRYEEAGAWSGETLATLIDDPAGKFPDGTALVHNGNAITYADLRVRVERLSSGFAGDGMVSGDRVLVQLPNVPELVTVCLALFRLGAMPVLAPAQYRSSEIRYICEHAGAVAYVVSGNGGYDYAGLGRELLTRSADLRRVYVAGTGRDGTRTAGAGIVPLAAVDAAPGSHPEPDPSDVALFLLSGGTTATPKLIPRTHNDYLYQLRRTTELTRLTSDDVYLAVLPGAFGFTLGGPGILGTLRAGGTVVLTEEPDPFTAMGLVASEGVTVVSLVPSLAQLWAEERVASGLDTGSLRVLQVGGSRLHRALAERLMTTFDASLQPMYGMAEGLVCMTRLDDPPEVVLGTQGTPLSPLDEIRIVGANGAVLPVGEFGELETRGPYTLRGYYRAPERNAAAFTPDGFYRTGDVARLTAQGHLEVTGRRKDVINRGGMKVSAAELESHLAEYDGVRAVAVVPVPDPVLGQRICACLEVGGERAPSLSDLRKYCLQRGLAEYKIPDRVEVMPALPLTHLGKIDKKSIESRLAANESHQSDGKAP
jgi:2,3-dihydroxybenzoate-AMP ligase